MKSDEPGDEEPPPPEQVGQPAAEQEHAAEHDRVGGHHPLQALLAEVQVGLDRGQRDVHDRDVEDDHELGGDDHRQHEPAFPVVEGSHRLAPIVEETYDSQFQRLAALTLFPGQGVSRSRRPTSAEPSRRTPAAVATTASVPQPSTPFWSGDWPTSQNGERNAERIEPAGERVQPADQVGGGREGRRDAEREHLLGTAAPIASASQP